MPVSEPAWGVGVLEPVWEDQVSLSLCGVAGFFEPMQGASLSLCRSCRVFLSLCGSGQVCLGLCGGGQVYRGLFGAAGGREGV